MPISPDDPTPVQLFVAAAGIGAIGGLAQVLRTQAVLTGRYVGNGILTGSLTALLTALIGHNLAREQANVWILLGVSGLAGYGGTMLLDAALNVLVKFVGKQADKYESGKSRKTGDGSVVLKREETPSDEVKP